MHGRPHVGPFSRCQSRAESSCLRLAAEGFVHEATVPPGPARSWVAQGRAMGLGGWCVAWAPGSPQLLRAAYCRENQRPGKVLDLPRAQLCHSLDPAGGPGGGPAPLTSASPGAGGPLGPALAQQARPLPPRPRPQAGPRPTPQGAQALRKTGVSSPRHPFGRSRWGLVSRPHPGAWTRPPLLVSSAVLCRNDTRIQVTLGSMPHFQTQGRVLRRQGSAPTQASPRQPGAGQGGLGPFPALAQLLLPLF